VSLGPGAATSRLGSALIQCFLNIKRKLDLFTGGENRRELCLQLGRGRAAKHCQVVDLIENEAIDREIGSGAAEERCLCLLVGVSGRLFAAEACCPEIGWQPAVPFASVGEVAAGAVSFRQRRLTSVFASGCSPVMPSPMVLKGQGAK